MGTAPKIEINLNKQSNEQTLLLNQKKLSIFANC